MVRRWCDQPSGRNPITGSMTVHVPAPSSRTQVNVDVSVSKNGWIDRLVEPLGFEMEFYAMI